MKKLGIYVNIPFCRKKCIYCNFTTYPLKFPVRDYFKAVNREISTLSPFLDDFTVDTIYFGGGTPSSIDISYINGLIESIFKSYKIDKSFEFTVEVNPEDLSEEFLKNMVDAGVNRISVGVESFSNETLNRCGRNEVDFELLFRLLDKYGDDISFNFDFIIGLLGDTFKIWEKNIYKLRDLNLSHLSFYLLEVHKKTKLFWDIKKERVKLLGEEDVIKIFNFVSSTIEEFGFMRYEISNFSKKGFKSKHNLKYWNREPYIGFGSSSHSFLTPYRISNTPFIREYIKNVSVSEKGFDFSNVFKLSLKEEIFEYFMMGMRKVEGVSLKEMEEKFGVDFYLFLKEKINFFIEEKLLKIDNDRLSFTSNGFLLSNLILSEILEVWEKICVE